MMNFFSRTSKVRFVYMATPRSQVPLLHSVKPLEIAKRQNIIFFYHPNLYVVLETKNRKREIEEESTATDDFVNAEEKILKCFTEILNECPSNASNQYLTLLQYFSEVADEFNSHCGNDHQSLQFIRQNMSDNLLIM